MMIPESVAVFFSCIVGLLCGSFLNVCILRLPAGESILTPRSRCRHCRRAIPAFDNIPVLSWLILRGRCRHCGQYPSHQLTPTRHFASGITPARKTVKVC